MNNAVVVSDSISPSTQAARAHGQGYTAETSFADTLDEVMDEVSEAEKTSTEDTDDIKGRAEDLVSEFVTMESILSELQGKLDALFKANDIERYPPVEIGYDSVNDMITVSNEERQDTNEIADLINGNSKLKEDFKNTLDKAQELVTLADNLFKYNDYLNSLKEEPPKVVGLLYGHQSSVMTDKPFRGAEAPVEPGESEPAESDELDELFAKIKEMMLMVFLQLDPEEEEEKKAEAASRDDNGASDDAKDEPTAEEKDALTAYQELLMSIERTRDAAMFKYGSDKNKYAMAIESYTMKAHREDTSESNNALNNFEEDEAETTSESATRSA